MSKTYMAVDQYGNTIHGLHNPRSDLLDRLGCSTCEKMYVDKKDGSSAHIGYIVGDSWYTIYEVIPWENPA